MAGSTFGQLFRITTFGESHGTAIGVVIDGCPAGLSLSEADIQPMLDRRKGGVQAYTTKRKESDTVQILSGVFEGKTTGTPIALVLFNEDQRSRDYSNIMNVFRPGHADMTFDAKYGFRDYRGGGRSSGRETACRVAAGAVACKLLSALNIRIESRILSIGGKDLSASLDVLKEAAEAMDSLGGVVEVTADGLPAGLGETVFDKLDADLAKAMMSIGAVKGVEIGDGFCAASSKGSDNNDGFHMVNGKICPTSNHAGGILGGMSNGAQIRVRTAFKPTPSIAQPQDTVTKDGEDTSIEIKGRHDVCIVPRAAVVTEAMMALTLADHLLRNMTARLDNVIRFYE